MVSLTPHKDTIHFLPGVFVGSYSECTGVFGSGDVYSLVRCFLHLLPLARTDEFMSIREVARG